MKKAAVLSKEEGPLYTQIETLIVNWIRDGKLLPGGKVPSVRQLSHDLKVSRSTIIQSYNNLESKGYIEAKPQSGFYVSLTSFKASESLFKTIKSKTVSAPQFIQTPSRNLQFVQSCGNPDLLQLGAAIIDYSFLPTESLNKSLIKVSRDHGLECMRYERLAGNLDLAQQLSKRTVTLGFHSEAEDFLITNGCMEAIALSIKAVTKPGDIVAVESPTFYSILRLLEYQNLKVLEIPTKSTTGLDLDVFEDRLKKFDVKAAILTPNFLNPLGSLMPDEQKEKLVKMSYKYQFTLIEDDIYGELHFAGKRPYSLKAFDDRDQIFYCNSFSKTLSPGYRVGWAIPPKKYREKMELLKASHSLANNSASQLAVADYLKNNNYDKHLRKLRATLETNMQKMLKCIELYFPPDTKVTHPQGGCLLWVEFPNQVSAIDLFDQALKQNIGIIPGTAFSSVSHYQNCIRMNTGVLWNEKIEKAIRFLGQKAFQAL